MNQYMGPPVYLPINGIIFHQICKLTLFFKVLQKYFVSFNIAPHLQLK
jgi:hypothetical protein